MKSNKMVNVCTNTLVEPSMKSDATNCHWISDVVFVIVVGIVFTQMSNQNQTKNRFFFSYKSKRPGSKKVMSHIFFYSYFISIFKKRWRHRNKRPRLVYLFFKNYIEFDSFHMYVNIHINSHCVLQI